jgi:hypothetical protein
VNELGFYSLNRTEVAKKVGISRNTTVAAIYCLGLKADDNYHKGFRMGKSKFDRYSPEPIDAIRTAVAEQGVAAIWDDYVRRNKNKQATTVQAR